MNANARRSINWDGNYPPKFYADNPPEVEDEEDLSWMDKPIQPVSEAEIF